MINYPRKIKNFAAYVDGFGYAGRATEGKFPELAITVANHRGGGMDAPSAVDMGMEAMTAELTLADWPAELIELLGTRTNMTLRAAAAGDDFTADAYVGTLGGMWSMVNFAELKPGSDVPLKLKLEVDLFTMSVNGKELFNIDVRAGKRVINGKDQMAEIRAAMGI